MFNTENMLTYCRVVVRQEMTKELALQLDQALSVPFRVWLLLGAFHMAASGDPLVVETIE